MNKGLKRGLIIGASVVFAAGAATGGIVLAKRNEKMKNPVEVQPVMNLATYGEPTYGSSYGQTFSDYIQEIFPDAQKKILEVAVAEGQEVKKGDVLLKYDTTLLEIQAEQARNDLEKLNLNIAENEKELAKAKRLTPWVEPPAPVIPEPEPLPESQAECYMLVDQNSVPFAGSGTAEDPYRYLVSSDVQIDTEFLVTLLGAKAELVMPEVPKPTKPKEPSSSETEPSGETPSESSTEETNPEKPTEPTNPTEPTDPAEPSGEAGTTEASEKPSGRAAEGSDAAQETKAPEAILTTAPKYVRFEVHEEDNENGRLYGGYALNGKEGFVILEPEPEEEIPFEPMPIDTSPHYTAEEIRTMISDLEKQAKELTLSRKEAELSLEKAEKSLEDATVVSRINGVVKTLISEEDARAENKPFLVVSGGDGLYVSGSVSESMLNQVKVGDSVTCNNWESGMTYDAEIIEITDKPSQNGGYGSGNPNSSYYEFVALIKNPGDLGTGKYLDMTIYTESGEADASALFLYKAYIRKENGTKYVMKVDPVTQTLVKQVIHTGKVMWGEYYEILDGIDESDYLAFPYGKHVKEGAPVTGYENWGLDQPETDMGMEETTAAETGEVQE